MIERFNTNRIQMTGDGLFRFSKLNIVIKSNEEFHNLHSSPNIIRTIKSRRTRCAGHVAQMGEKRKAYAYRILVGKPQGKRPLGRPRRI
jgi:hypothetical protein